MENKRGQMEAHSRANGEMDSNMDSVMKQTPISILNIKATGKMDSNMEKERKIGWMGATMMDSGKTETNQARELFMEVMEEYTQDHG